MPCPGSLLYGLTVTEPLPVAVVTVLDVPVSSVIVILKSVVPVVVGVEEKSRLKFPEFIPLGVGGMLFAALDEVKVVPANVQEAAGGAVSTWVPVVFHTIAYPAFGLVDAVQPAGTPIETLLIFVKLLVTVLQPLLAIVQVKS